MSNQAVRSPEKPGCDTALGRDFRHQDKHADGNNGKTRRRAIGDIGQGTHGATPTKNLKSADRAGYGQSKSNRHARKKKNEQQQDRKIFQKHYYSPPS